VVKHLSSAILKFISANYPDKTGEELEIIEYGLEGIIMTIPKAIVILAAGYCLQILPPLLLAIFSFGFLRTFASGVHLKNGWTCLFFSSSAFFFITYAGKYINLTRMTQIEMLVFSMVLLFLYAPADTEERPLLDERVRRRMKVSALLAAGLMFAIVMILPENNMFGNIIAWGITVESIMTTPLIYYLFNRRYRNYEYYES